MDAARRLPLVFNPAARSRRGNRVMRFLMRHADRFAVYATTKPGEACALARRFSADGEPVVIAAGGDGTVNEVVCGLAGSSTALGVLPVGTMNVFAREMGIPLDPLDRSLAVIERGYIREIDLFEVNGHPFVQMAGIGFDARVIEETSWESKMKLGPLAYLLATVKVMGERPPQMVIELPEGKFSEGVAVLAGNGSLYGGQFRFFRNADNTDSMLDILVYKESGYRVVLDSLRGLALGGIDLLDSVECHRAAHFTVRCDRDVPIEVDGEWLGRFPQALFRQRPGHLRVLAPEEAPASGFAEALKSLFGKPTHELGKAAAP
jgi:diacylglycerol kinase (ATP)